MKKAVVVSAASVGDLPAFKELPEMAGHPQVSARLGTVEVEKSEGAMVGIWECSVGSFRRQVTQREFSHFLKGRCTFTPDGGEPVEIKAGEAAYFPANCFGTWDVTEAIRKTFIILD